MVNRPLRHRARVLATAALAALTLALTVTPSAASASPPTLNRVDAAAGWLARQSVDGERFEVVFDGVAYPDQGLTLDAVFAFAAAKVADTTAANAVSWLAQPAVLTGYIGDGTEAYAGATAKLSLGAQVRGLDPAAFGGVDLLTRLGGLLTPSGRYSDRSAFGDYSNTFTQSFAVLASDRAGGAPPAAVTFLAASRCADGGFPLLFGQATCVSDVDATAIAVQALLAADRPLVAASAAQWLVSVQGGDGSFSANGVPNANSTGLAAQALAVAGRPLPWLRARQFLIGLQVACTGPSTERGAIAYTSGGFDATTAVRATAQAVPGLAGTGYATLSASGAQPAAPVLACAPW
ncbi:prenyltransferase/squalene oxidase repeat-containing protein [Micromonospora sp. NPDC047762]|uniref:prenyltransferase/squalene oxidase repeat-containing protein n=1 Tax=Micromonospora sp. NPDC047762 TaxID=3364255 RepID=UPI00371ECE60